MTGAHAYFRVSSFAEAAEFAAAIAEVADNVGHFPDVDLRADAVPFGPSPVSTEH